MSDILSIQSSEIIGYGIVIIALLFFIVSILVAVINTVRVLKQEANNNNMPKERMNGYRKEIVEYYPAKEVGI